MNPTGRSRPSRETAEGRAYLDIRGAARAAGRTVAEYESLYVLEGFLARLEASPYAGSFVLKGGVLLAAYQLRRPTRDVDFAALDQSRESRDVLERIVAIARTAPAVEDGIAFDVDTAHAESIRDEDEYNGVRVTLIAHVHRARVTFHVDVNVGDPIWPEPQTVHLPRLLGGEEIELQGYPMEMVLAEKIVTALQRGTASTRWRDYADVYLITGTHVVDGGDLRRAMETVATHRGADVEPLGPILEGYADLGQGRWLRWRDRFQLSDRLPERFADVVTAVTGFADPVLADPGAVPRTWDPGSRHWAYL